MHPLERLVNLVALLLEAPRPVPFDRIRDLIEAYQQQDPASAKRMFERDKDMLREVGIPVEVASTDAWEVEQGYRIPKDLFYLPEVTFSSEEVWALFVAAHAPGEDAEAQQAFLKLSTGADASILSAMAERPATPGVDTSGPHLGTVAEALDRRRRIRFRYSSSHGRSGSRTVDPYALVFRGGNWYLVGRDTARDEIRSYRLSRMSGAIREAGDATAPPEGFDAADHLQAGPWGLGQPEVIARVAFSQKVAWWAVASTPGARVVRATDQGWTEVEVPASRGDAFASWVLSFGPEARVVAPSDIAERVRDALVGLAG